MDLKPLASLSEGAPLPLPSLRLLVPPVHLVTASMWQVLRRRDASNYWEVAELVSLVVDMVPELLMHKHSMQLDLGLRARFILELCRNETLIKPEFVLSYLDKMSSSYPASVKVSEEEEATVNFLELIHVLLKDVEERREFFLEVFPVDYGPDYDNDLQTLFWEFLCRLTQLLPVPDLQQTVSWLGSECSVLEDCVRSVSEQTDLKNLLQYHRNLGHLEQHVPPSSMGDVILSSLCAAPPNKAVKPPGPSSQSDPPPGLGEDPHTVSFVDDVAVEIIAVTDYAEIELGTSANVEVVMEGSCCEVDAAGENPEEETNQNDLRKEEKNPAGPHDCPDCQKKFRFASSLVAHRVIHTGERPHRCADCGHCFSFRQSLDRHRRTHKTRRQYDCGICGEAFRSASARTEHKQSHVENGVYVCRQCNRKFHREAALAKHLRTHGERRGEDGEDVGEGHVEVADPQIPAGDDGEKEPEEGQRGRAEVRTSGRKRRPTMKLQVMNLEKRRRKKERDRATPPPVEPAPANCAKQSGGSAAVSSQGDDKSSTAGGPVAAFSCSKCSFQHSEEVAVQQHIEQVHKDKINAQEDEEEEEEEEGNLSCSHCEKSFRFPSSLRAHQRSHTGEQPFSCSQCGRRFSFKQSLERHKQTHQAGRRHQCVICGEAFPSHAAQREHQSAHKDNGEFLCSRCGRAFAWKSALVRHLKTHGAEPNGKEAAAAAAAHGCPRCGLSFSCASHLSRHLHTHQEERIHACSCGKSFAYRAALTAHQRTHLKERPHVCSQCGKGFLYRGGLRSHMKIHSEEKPYMCSFCGKSFKRERNMKKHERCHTRQDVFRCSQCDKSFVYKATLVRHVLTHSGERPFLCSDCGKGFFSHAELLKHERFHTGHKPFQCAHCGKSFTQSCYLTVHLRYHTGARPYSCGECDKSFLSANRLKRHQRTHTGEKPYLCVECGKGFRQSYNLKIHQRTHDGKPT